MADPATPTVGDFQPATTGDFQAAGDVQPSITQHDPETYAGLTVQNAIKGLSQQGLTPYMEGKDVIDLHKQALDRAQNFQADIAKQAAAKQQELVQRGLAAQRGPQGQPSLLETEEAEKAGVAMKKELAQKQAEQGPMAQAESASMASQPGAQGPLIQALPDDQRVRLEHMETAYQTLNNLQQIHANTVQSAIGAGGNIRSRIGDLFQTSATNKYARALESYTDESLTPLAVGILGDRAAGATKANIQEQLRGTIPDRTDTLESAGNKIFLMKQNLMTQLQSMRDLNRGKYSTGEISNLYMDLNKDFQSPDVQKFDLTKPLNQQQPVVNVGNSPEGKAQIATAASAGATPPPVPAVTPAPAPAVSPTPAPAQQNQPQQQNPQAAQQQPFDIMKFMFGGVGS